MSTLVFELPEVPKHFMSTHRKPLLVVTTAWTAEGHPDGRSTVVSYPVDLQAAHGITNSGVASFRFDVPVADILALASEGGMVDLRGHVPHPV